jgi:hypothetical protein
MDFVLSETLNEYLLKSSLGHTYVIHQPARAGKARQSPRFRRPIHLRRRLIPRLACKAFNVVSNESGLNCFLYGAIGYLVDQFVQEGTNKRTDVYGGTLESVQVLISVWGADRVGVRISPYTV